MNVITRDELKEKLDRGEPIKLVNVLEEWAFRAKHIPDSINIPINGGSFEQLSREEEVVVYCSGTPCPASWLAAKRLASRGYQRIRYLAAASPPGKKPAIPL